MRYAFIDQQREQDDNPWPVRVMCRTLRVSRNGFYDYARCQASPGPRAARRAVLAAKVEQAHADSRGIYGSPRVCTRR